MCYLETVGSWINVRGMRNSRLECRTRSKKFRSPLLKSGEPSTFRPPIWRRCSCFLQIFPKYQLFNDDRRWCSKKKLPKSMSGIVEIRSRTEQVYQSWLSFSGKFFWHLSLHFSLAFSSVFFLISQTSPVRTRKNPNLFREFYFPLIACFLHFRA